MTNMTEQIFIELLRAYLDGCSKTHAAEPRDVVAINIAKEAYFMNLAYMRTIEELEKS